MTARRMNQLLLDLYACPTGQRSWSDVLDGLCQSMRVRSAVVQLLVLDGRNTRSKWMVRDSASEAARVLHDRYFSDSVNPRMQASRAARLQGQPIVRDQDFFDPDDPLYIDLQRRLSAVQLGRFISARLPFAAGQALALVLHRHFDDHDDFNRTEERFALDFMPHLRQAVQLSMTLHGANRHIYDLRESIDSLRSALVLCNADTTVSWMNRAAEQLLARRHALWIHNEKLTAASTAETSNLRRTIFAAAHAPSDDAEPEYCVVGSNSEDHALHMRLRRIDGPTTEGHSASCPRVLVMLSDPSDAPALPAELLRRLFGLSPAESRLAAALCGGATLNEYARDHDISVGTARYQLKQIMAKTHVSRQAQLVQRLYSSVIAQALH
jgi:DNA-binding CsgD family transcriptional regulator